MRGTVKFFDKKKGWGFITADSGTDYFIHYSGLNNIKGCKTLDSGDIVSFDIGLGTTEREQAVNVKPILTMKMIEDSLKKENLYVRTIKDGYGMTKYLIVDQNNIIQVNEQGMSFAELATYSGFDKEIKKEKVKRILGEFFERNKNYSVNAYIKNGITGCFIARLLLPINRNIISTDEKFQIESNVYDSIVYISYDEVFDCYEERNEFGSQTVVVILKNGMKMEFECCGDRM